MAAEDTTDGVAIDELDGTFIPRPVDDIAAVELDGETVLGVRSGDGMQTFCLNRTGGIVWSCFDGEATLDELIDDFSDAFTMPRDVVAEDVLLLTRQLGMIGVLAGVKQGFNATEYSLPTGLDVGSELPPALLTDFDGEPASLDSFRGRRILLVNWSPACGFCDRIAPELAGLDAQLRNRGVELVLVALGNAEMNREVLDRHGLTCTALLQQSPVEAFYGAGTPSAYLIDEAGRVAAPMALGADQVPALAREVAGP